MNQVHIKLFVHGFEAEYPTKRTLKMNTTLPAANFKFALDEQFLTTDEYEQRFKKSKASQCRDRAAGQGPPFVVDGNKILYPLSLALAYHSNRLVNSTAEINSTSRGNRYKHLVEARNKAMSQRAANSTA
jgi:hypothetical protein